MHTYDFSTLNDKDFETLSTALLSRKLQKRVERFKPGPDAGVDGRFFASDSKETIIQCKHWLRSGFSKLKSALKKTELSKILKLSPERYILTTSIPLSRKQKKELKATLAPFIRCESDIFGQEDLNDILAQHEDIERSFYKLWLTSTTALSRIIDNGIWGRSQWRQEDIAASTARYVRTRDHDEAIKILNEHHVVVITGEPGVGKTTLAEQLCLELCNDGFTLVSMTDDIDGAERTHSPATKQAFIYDDFLGRNYFSALNKNEDTKITQFIRRIRQDKTKRLILTSRTTILNQGKQVSDQFRIHNLSKREYELQVRTLARLEKAKMLYNHLWFGHLSEDFIEEIYTDKRYRKIIDHKNFNPRLIEFITDHEKHSDRQAHTFWNAIQEILDNPIDIWEHVLNVQVAAEVKSLTILSALNNAPISEAALRTAFNALKEAPGSMGFPASPLDFHDASRLATGAILTRHIPKQNEEATFNLFTPSIGDYILHRYKDDPDLLATYFKCLGTNHSIDAIRALQRSKIISKQSHERILKGIASTLSSPPNEAPDGEYRSHLARHIITQGGRTYNAGLAALFQYIIAGQIEVASSRISHIALWALSNEEIRDADEKLLQYLLDSDMEFSSDREIDETLELYSALQPEQREAIESPIASAISLFWNSEFENWVANSDTLSEYMEPAEEQQALDAVWEAADEVLSSYPKELAEGLAEQLVERIDVEEQLRANREHALAEDYEQERGDYASSSNQESESSAIEELFHRG